MKTLTKISLATALATLLASGGAFAEYAVQRIDHPNGQPNFVPVRERPAPTVAVFVEGRSFGRPVVVERQVVVRDEELITRPVPLHRGRGETIWIRGKELR